MKTAVPRLIDQFRPKSYELTINQNSETMSFSGSIVINGAFTRPSKTLILHSDELQIESALINSNPASITTSTEDQTITLTSGQKNSNDAVVEISFSGKITKPMHGLYPCFFEHEGKEKRLLATQFESHHAREVFPCIDEPEAKAVFTLSLTTDEKDTVVSNTPISTENIKNGLKTTTFEPTPIMSTYLLAWVSGELTYEESKTKHGVTVRAYSTPVHTGKTSYGLEVACKALDYMDDYFDIPYPLQKCDIIALPDFAAGAMENWGCITFRESAMLVDLEQSDLGDKQHVAEVVVHELAHQWFGNLVTMRWWEDLWLNEGFASWVPYIVLNELFPKWNVWEQFSTGDLMIGLRADALAHTHPIVVTIQNPNEIRSAFDSISYDKGCSVINLLFRYIGAEAFRDGLRSYLKTHAYSNAETSDLRNAWSKSSGKDVAGFMNTWTTKTGFPIVKAITESDNSTSLIQERFYLDKPENPDKTIRPIPLMRSSDDGELFETEKPTISTSGKLNVGQSGFYRVVYDAKLREKILSSKPAAVDLLGLINDSSEAARAGYQSTIETLELIMKVKDSNNESLIGTALSELAGIRTILSDSYEHMKPLIATFISYNLNRLGIEKLKSDTVDDELLRPQIIAAASYAGDKNIVTWAINEFNSAKTPEDIRSDMRSVVYQTAVRELGTKEVHDKLMQWYFTNTIPGEQIALASAITSFKDEEIIKANLALITSDKIKLQDSLYWIAYSLASRHSKQLSWAWLQKNWDWIGANFGKDKEIDYYLRYGANGFASKEHLADYTVFFESVDIYGSRRAFEQGKETISWQMKWKERDQTEVTAWLKNNQ